MYVKPYGPYKIKSEEILTFFMHIQKKLVYLFYEISMYIRYP